MKREGIALVGLALLLTTSAARAADSQGAARTAADADRGYYINAMLLGGVLTGDTGRGTAGGLGLALRVGAQIDERHQVGARLQAMILPSQGSLDSGQRQGSAIASLLAGGEYRYTSERGIYLAGTVAFAMTLTGEEIDPQGPEGDSRYQVLEPMQDNLDNSFGAGVLGSVGYEYRLASTCTINAELFGGYYLGQDQDAHAVSNGTLGLALGLGL